MKFIFLLLFSLCSYFANSQETGLLFKEADNLERQLKDVEALDKYKQILVIEPANLKALIKAAELNAGLGGRELNKVNKRLYTESAMVFAKKAYETDSKNADANYVMAMVSGKMTDIETENKKIVQYVKEVKMYSEKALAINPSHARANYSLGKWHYEMVNLMGLKKVAVKLFYGGMPDGDLDSAILHFEKCKSADPYFVLNYLDLAKAYRDNHRPTQTIEILNKLVKLPIRTADDAALKAEGAKLLDAVQ
jgi:tetratricopeptide (TPR) repeat protein